MHLDPCTAWHRSGQQSSIYLPVVWVERLGPRVAVRGRISLQQVSAVGQLELHLGHASSILQVATTLLLLLHLQCIMAPAPVCMIQDTPHMLGVPEKLSATHAKGMAKATIGLYNEQDHCEHSPATAFCVHEARQQ